MRNRKPGQRRGFTLIELIVVLVIIATLAGLAVPLVAYLGRSTDMAASAKSQADVNNNLQLFFLLQKRFPQGLDSLMVGPGGTDPTEIYGPADSAGAATTSATLQVSGLPVSSPALCNDLTVGTLTSGQRRSFTRLGFEWVMDHTRTPSDSNSNNSGVNQRTLPSSGTMVAAVITSGSPAALKLLPATSGVPETGSQLVAVGFGPSNAAVGKTIQQAPIYPGCDGKYYGRYIAVFQVYDSGERGALIGVMDSYGRAPDYTIQQFNESMPNNGRQG